jgi:lipoprotein-anchoring transpeptidase ErfK/SrfK
MPKKLSKGKKSVAKAKKSNFLKKHFWLFISLIVGIGIAFVINPYPAPITASNISQKVSHLVLSEPNELLSESYVDDITHQSGEYDQTQLAGVYGNQPAQSFANAFASTFQTTVLGDAHTKVLGVNDNKWIEVDLGQQKIRAWEGDQKKMEFLISSGKPWTPTPVGEYRIWIKLRYANMSGGSKAAGDYYNLPNVPYVMYFYKGYGIHGAYWHMNFGHPMSHGCVNMKPDEAKQIFEWAGPDMQGKSVIKATDDNPGTRVVVHQ